MERKGSKSKWLEDGPSPRTQNSSGFHADPSPVSPPYQFSLSPAHSAGFQDSLRGRVLRCVFLVGAVLAVILSVLNLSSLIVCEKGHRGAHFPQSPRVVTMRNGRTVLAGPWGDSASSLPDDKLPAYSSSSVPSFSTGSLAALPAIQQTGNTPVGGTPMVSGGAVLASVTGSKASAGVSAGSSPAASTTPAAEAKVWTPFKEPPSTLPTGGKTAVCLVGGARSFEATGPSILKYVVKAYEPCDVFLHAPLDQDSAKFWAVQSAEHVVGVRVFPNCEVIEANHPTEVLQAAGSPQGCQGLLQYFRLVEGCLEMILAHERHVGERYKWIVRARVDAFWRAPSPPLSSLNASAYNIPYGNDFHGYNDRFGAGLHWPSEVAMRRLSLMSQIKEANLSSSHNSEKAYRMQFVLSETPVARHHNPFCVVTHRLPSNITDQCDPAVPSLASDMPMDGTKCMPCQLCNSRPNETVMGALFKYMDVVKGPDGQWEGRAAKLQVCNLTDAWKPRVWQKRFDQAVEPGFALARHQISTTTLEQCVEKMAKLKSRTHFWDSPSPAALCLRRKLGPALPMGEGDGTFNTFKLMLSPSSVVISARLRDEGDRSWEMEVQRAVGAKVLVWFRADLSAFHASLDSIGVTKVDVLKLSAEGHDLRVLHKWIQQQFHPPVCQLLVSFPKKIGVNKTRPALTGGWERLAGNLYKSDMDKLRFQLDGCVGGQNGTADRCLFYSLKHCTFN